MHLCLNSKPKNIHFNSWQVRLSYFVGRHHEAGKPARPGGPPQVSSHCAFGALIAEWLQVRDRKHWPIQLPSVNVRAPMMRMSVNCRCGTPVMLHVVH